jgi:hypothetical protein
MNHEHEHLVGLNKMEMTCGNVSIGLGLYQGSGRHGLVRVGFTIWRDPRKGDMPPVMSNNEQTKRVVAERDLDLDDCF